MNLNRKRLVFLSRLLVIITISYIILLGPGRSSLQFWGYAFIAFYLATNLIVYYLPDKFFSSPALYYCIVLVDCLLVVGGIYLSGMEGSDLYLVFFVIVCLATLGSKLRNLIIVSFVFVTIYGWLLYQQGLLQGNMAVSYCLRLPFILVVSLFLGYIVDIQTKDQKARLRKFENRYRSFVENLPIGVYQQTAGDDSRFLMMNKAFLDQFGYKESGMLKREVRIIYADPEQYQDMMLDMAQGSRIEAYPLDLLRRDGSVFNANVWARKYTHETGEIIEGVVIDVTKLRKTERALAESEERLRFAGKASYDLVYEINVNDNRLQWFGDVDGKLGYAPGEVSERLEDWFKIIHPDDLKQISNIGRIDPFNMDLNSCEYRIKNKEGCWLYWNDCSVPVPDKEGNIVKWIGVCTDITKNKEMEQQLLQAQKMEAIGVLAGGVAHNFNNMLMGILGYVSELIINKSDSDPEYETLKSIDASIKEAASLTKNLLGFARRGAYEVSSLNLNDLIAKEGYIFSCANKNIRIHELLAENLWVVEADKSQIQQVLMNLYLNAVQAMRETGCGEIYVKTENVLLSEKTVQPHNLSPGKYVKIIIRDTGCGMDEAIRRKIFDPFFTTKKQGEGTGLGLSSVYGIVKNHSGFIEVDSEIALGTTFVLYFPASDKSVKENKTKTMPLEAVNGSGTILIVDDEAMVIKSCERLLKRLNYKVLSAQNGETAISVYKEQGKEIDLIMLDMLMPDMSGRIVFEKIMEIDPDAKVLLSSGFSLNDQARGILEKGCSGFIQKPFDINELSQKINEIIRG
jgi:PAS domain S-box-containing protein